MKKLKNISQKIEKKKTDNQNISQHLKTAGWMQEMGYVSYYKLKMVTEKDVIGKGRKLQKGFLRLLIGYVVSFTSLFF